jgi:tetratricopeptide (TPR) repeat protein
VRRDSGTDGRTGPRREGGSLRQLPPGPPIPEDVEARELDRGIREELRTLPKDLADSVARHLVMVGRLLDEDPDEAYRHAVEARRRAARVGAVREAAGLAAYACGNWAEAITDLRAARRLGSGEDLLPVIADCERGLGRPERALALASSPEAARLDEGARVEMRIVASGARRDLGQADAAVVALQGPDLQRRPFRPWSARLFYAYADALDGAGRADEARQWLVLAAQADSQGETDAAERLAEMDGITFDYDGDADA